MKKLVVANVAIAVLLASGASNAADLARPLPVKAPIAAPAPGWTGLYAGLSVGARWTDSTWTTTSIEVPAIPLRTGNPATASLNSTSARIGGFIGYNWQFAPAWVAGIEADLAWGDNKKSSSPIPATVFLPGSCSGAANCSLDSITAKASWDGSVRGRFGYLIAPTWMIYATGGVAWQQFELSAVCGLGGPWCTANRSESTSWTRVGWTVGGGVETMLWGNWLARAEYRYADFGTVTHSFFTSAPFDTVAMSEPLRTHTATVGLAYKFGGP